MYIQYSLPYAADALEPVIDKETVETHHGKHHATYTKALNDFAEKAGVQDKPIEELLSNLEEISDPNLRQAIRNNGGGFYNHNLYFETLTPGGSEPCGKFAERVTVDFGSFDALKEKLTELALSQFGSGWAFLSAAPDGKLIASKSPNQDNPLSEKSGNVPIACIDVWEHAYYLKYKNLRADYVKALLTLIDWKKVSEKYEKAL